MNYRKIFTIGVGFLALAFLVVSVVPANAQFVRRGEWDPTNITPFELPVIIPPQMPKSSSSPNIDHYVIPVRQFQQPILPGGVWNTLGFTTDNYPSTTVWSYGSQTHPGTAFEGGTFNYPAFTIEAEYGKSTRVTWKNDLVDSEGNFLPHLLSVDQTLHWANPPQDCIMGDPRTDCSGQDQTPYLGPVPIVTHVHGAHTYEDSDGYPEAWYLPNARNIPRGYAREGSFYRTFKMGAKKRFGANWGKGEAQFDYPNEQAATTLWYHDHTLGMTRLNVYAGPAGFYLLRGGDYDLPSEPDCTYPTDDDCLPGPAPDEDTSPLDHVTGPTVFEIPLAIQDRSFRDTSGAQDHSQTDGSLFYPADRAFFEENSAGDQLNPCPFDANPETDCTEPYLQIPFIPDSDIAPIWNPEAFFNTMVVNGVAYPFMEVKQRQYRLRLLNGCNSRFLILGLLYDDGGETLLEFTQIGAEGGFLPNPVVPSYPVDGAGDVDGLLLMAPAERADVIVDFTDLDPGTEVLMINLGPDEPFGGGAIFDGFDPADPFRSGMVMLFKVVGNAVADNSTPVGSLTLPTPTELGPIDTTLKVSLNEEMSAEICVEEDADGNVVLVDGSIPTGEETCSGAGEPFGPKAALLGTVTGSGVGAIGNAKLWSDTITENINLDEITAFEIYNFTADAHPIHIHLVQFEVVGRQEFDGGTSVVGQNTPLPNETGFKDTVIAYPDEITTVKAKFDLGGLFVWHCHIVEHEDNEMMRPYCAYDTDDPSSRPDSCDQADGV